MLSLVLPSAIKKKTVTTMHNSMLRSLAFPSFGLLDRSQCETIHDASLEILRRTGVRVYHPEALALLRQAGASIVDENLVRLEPALVQWALAGAPKRLVLCRRGSNEAAVRLEGQEVYFGPGSDCLHYLDPCTGEHRPFQNQDVIVCICLVDALPELSFCMSMGIPADLGLATLTDTSLR